MIKLGMRKTKRRFRFMKEPKKYPMELKRKIYKMVAQKPLILSKKVPEASIPMTKSTAKKKVTIPSKIKRDNRTTNPAITLLTPSNNPFRSEERRVGNEC